MRKGPVIVLRLKSRDGHFTTTVLHGSYNLSKASQQIDQAVDTNTKAQFRGRRRSDTVYFDPDYHNSVSVMLEQSEPTGWSDLEGGSSVVPA